jgi:hypothetical protein
MDFGCYFSFDMLVFFGKVILGFMNFIGLIGGVIL